MVTWSGRLPAERRQQLVGPGVGREDDPRGPVRRVVGDDVDRAAARVPQGARPGARSSSVAPLAVARRAVRGVAPIRVGEAAAGPATCPVTSSSSRHCGQRRTDLGRVEQLERDGLRGQAVRVVRARDRAVRRATGRDRR